MGTEYTAGLVVLFGEYAEDVDASERIFAAGDKVKIVRNDDSGTAENPAFLIASVDDETKQAFAFSSELGDAVKAKGTRKAPPAVSGKGKGKGLTDEQKAKEAAKKLKVKEKADADKAKAKAKKEKEREVAKPKRDKEREEAKVEKAKAKEAKAKEREAAKLAVAEVNKLKHATSVLNITAQGGKMCLEEALKVAKRIGSDFYTLGGLLHEIKEMAYYETIVGGDGHKLMGQPGFEEYVRSELGIEYRMAQHYINVYVVTRRAGIPEGKVKNLKCSKVVALLGLIKQGAITKDNWGEWSEKATDLKGDAYKEAVEKAHVAAGIEKKSRGVTANQVRFTFVLFEDRAEVANKALAMAKAELPAPEDGSEVSNSAAFDLIIGQWATMKADQ